MDAFKVLRSDHQVIEALFTAYKSSTGIGQKESFAKRLIAELSSHLALEENFLFRVARERGVGLQQLAQRGADIHHQITSSLAELRRVLANPGEEQEAHLDAAVKALQVQARRQVQEDNNWMFPALKQVFGASELESIGAQMVESRTSARRRSTSPGVIALGDGSEGASREG